MAKNKLVIDDSLFNGIGAKVKESREQSKGKFKKPSADYYNLDLIVRESVIGADGRKHITAAVKTNYKEYLDSVRGTQSITKYIHNLIDQDMERNKKK